MKTKKKKNYNYTHFRVKFNIFKSPAPVNCQHEILELRSYCTTIWHNKQSVAFLFFIITSPYYTVHYEQVGKRTLPDGGYGGK